LKILIRELILFFNMSFRKLGDNENVQGTRVILLHNFSDSEVIEFINHYKKNENLPKSIIAVTTPTSLEWKVRDLMDELIKEDEEIKKRKKEK